MKWVARHENPVLVCASHKDPAKALKQLSSIVGEFTSDDANWMLLGLNTSYDDEGFYNLTATISYAS